MDIENNDEKVERRRLSVPGIIWITGFIVMGIVAVTWAALRYSPVEAAGDTARNSAGPVKVNFGEGEGAKTGTTTENDPAPDNTIFPPDNKNEELPEQLKDAAAQSVNPPTFSNNSLPYAAAAGVKEISSGASSRRVNTAGPDTLESESEMHPRTVPEPASPITVAGNPIEIETVELDETSPRDDSAAKNKTVTDSTQSRPVSTDELSPELELTDLRDNNMLKAASINGDGKEETASTVRKKGSQAADSPVKTSNAQPNLDKAAEAKTPGANQARKGNKPVDVAMTPDGLRYVENRVGRASKASNYRTDVYHYVHKGETLYQIALYYYGPAGAVKINDIISANDKLNSSRDLAAGTTIVVPNVPEGGTDVSMESVLIPSDSGTLQRKTQAVELPVLPVKININRPKHSGGRNAAASAVQPGGDYSEHVVRKGDTLSRIARDYYKDGRLWKDIYEANRDRLADPNTLPVGCRLRIPNISTEK